MKNVKKIIQKICLATTVLTVTSVALTGCSNKTPLDPNDPVSLTIWHYYNGSQQVAFDALTEEFNETIGREKGIYVQGYSQGSVSDLETAIRNSISGKVGAEAMPDIFSSYVDTAYEVEQAGALANLSIIGPVVILSIAVFYAVYFSYMDRKEFGGLTPMETSQVEAADSQVPGFYGLFPLIPLTLVVVFSFVDGIKMDVITAHIIDRKSTRLNSSHS